MTTSRSRNSACLFAAAGLLLAALACGGGSRSTGDQVATANLVLAITPAVASVAPGQTLQFSANTPWGSGVTWSVQPATGGSINAAGLFTASSTPGQCLVLAMWNNDVRYTASATVTILPPPPAAVISPSLVQASGVQQTVPGTGIAHAAVVGESVPATNAVGSVDPSVKVRHGFEPPK
ncbi:MAG: hypothetical protein HGB30_00440 [Holophagaceae bacterium]|nr:hypothetical protein [Holophagaceae bacterium]